MPDSETQVGQDRRTLDVFDPTADGFTPHTLEQTIEAARDVIAVLERFDAALHGCMTPLNLSPLARKSQKVSEEAEAWSEELAKVRDIIERDLPLSDSLGWLQDPEPEYDPDDQWTGLLSPGLIVTLRARAADLPLGRLTTYRQEVAKADATPSLVRTHRRQELKKAWRASLAEGEYELLLIKRKAARSALLAQRLAARPTAGPAASDNAD